MTEAAKSRTRTTTDPAPEPVVPPQPDLAAGLATHLRKFVDWRREQLRRVAQPGINRGGPAAIRAGQEEQVLSVFDTMATWLEGGAPGPGTLLTEEEKDRWRWAKVQGLSLPPGVEAQL